MSKIFLLTGLSGAGKTTLARIIHRRLAENGHPCVVLDGDELRSGVCSDLNFSRRDREENLRRCGEIARLLQRQGTTVLMALIAPYERARLGLAELVGRENLRVAHISCPLEECARRDPKKNYCRAMRGEIKNYTGIGDIYEEPQAPDIVVRTDVEDIDHCADKLYKYVREQLEEN